MKKINLYSYYINYGFKKIETIDDKELSDLLKFLNYILNNAIILHEMWRKKQKLKTLRLRKQIQKT